MNIRAFALSFVIAAATPTVAFPCSPSEGMEYVPPQVTIGEIGKPTAIAYTLVGQHTSEAVTVVSPTGEAVEGVINHDSPVDVRLFVPAEPMAAGVHTVTVTLNEGADGAEPLVFMQLVDVREVADPITEVELFPGVLENEVGTVCCTTDRGPQCDCGGCAVCWPSGYEYHRQLGVNVSTSRPVVATLEMVNGRDGVDNSVVQAVLGGTSAAFLAKSLDAEEECVTVTISEIEGGEISSETYCASASEFPELDPREPDAPDQVAQCIEPPAETDDPNWVKYGEQSKADSGGGCSTSNAPASITTWLVGLVGLIFVRRRR